ncbi:transmembrane protein 205 isoform X1 [Rana temporaria]|uniref:transmembrane protein 205 isoform X1 n=2 Tax=Rana temporaria TaxID=8407 RepID=UPI001AAD6B8B|nr:transmembrane protein 205 isoform X1 [Rana temporaria]
MQGRMVTEGEPGSLVKVVYLLVLSASWGMQFWTTFVAGFVLIRGVTRHTFGLVQSKLFPFYNHMVMGFSFLNLCVYAMYHPRELLSPSESVQIALFFISLIVSALHARWFSPSTSKIMFKMHAIEREHGLGQGIGLSANREGYKLLQEKDPKYQALRKSFLRYHGISSLCNLVCLLCNGANLVFTALLMPTL